MTYADLRRVPLAGADLRYDARAFDAPRANALMETLRAQIPWEQQRLRLFGRVVDAPRLSCWMGDRDAAYTYSRTRFEPVAWAPAVAALRDELHARTGHRFNSVLANLYRDGRDAMGWHSDDEAELGEQPVIASLSFGAARTFLLRDRATRAATLSMALDHGSLLVMAGATQSLYQHALPRRLRERAPRINLTFRYVLTERRREG